jgi:hypothetical protein
MTPGTSQRDRPLAALGDKQFAVDGLTLDQRVALSTRLAGRLRFVNLNNQAEGNWRNLFVNDEALVLARIASLDTWGVRTRYLRVCDSAAPVELARWVSELAQLVNSWLHELSGARLPAALRVREALEQRVEQQLGATQAWLRRHYPDADAGMREAWHGKWPPPATSEDRSTGGHTSTLRSAGFSLLNTLSTLKALAREGLPSTLDTGDHEAAPGLLLAFLRLYGVVQADINGFTDRHIDFYYRHVLGFEPLATQPDLALVACQRDPRAGIEVVVPAGARFVAGKDAAGEDIVFRAAEALAVSNARVAALATLRLEHDPLIQPEASLGFATGIRAHWLGVPTADAAPVPALGGGTGSHAAHPGLAVASPLLGLKEGRREIHVTLRLRWPREQSASDPGDGPPGRAADAGPERVAGRRTAALARGRWRKAAHAGAGLLPACQPAVRRLADDGAGLVQGHPRAGAPRACRARHRRRPAGAGAAGTRGPAHHGLRPQGP